jgi:4-amino-4-deoxy-L-arabinose transferase-like glycosyltransferase
MRRMTSLYQSVYQWLRANPLAVMLWLLLAAIWFLTLDYRALIKTDEGRYAEIAREMWQSGDWVTPRLNDIKYFEKPVLQAWMTAIAYSLFGVNEWTARLWVAVSSFLGLMATWWTTRRCFDADTAHLATAIQASSLLYIGLGHINTLDMGLCFFMQLTLNGLLLAHQPQATSGERLGYMLLCWASMAGAILSKGLIGIVLPGFVLTMYILVTRQWRLITQLHWVFGLLVFFGLVTPWFYAVSQANPEFLHFFFIHEHFERFLTKVHRRYGPPWYFIPILILGMLPWISMTLVALGSALKQHYRTLRHATEFQPLLMLTLWSVLIFGFFSASSSKLPSYILPIIPALSMVTAIFLIKAPIRHIKKHLLGLMVLFSVMACLIPLIDQLSDDYVRHEAYERYEIWLFFAALMMLGGLFYALRRIELHRMSALLVLAGTSVIAWTAATLGHESLGQTVSMKYHLQRMMPTMPANAPFYSVEMYEQTLPFYLGRPVIMVAHQDELAFGLQQEPHKWLPERRQFEQRWINPQQPAYALVPATLWQQYQKTYFPMTTLYRDGRLALIANPAASQVAR